ncbi:hypothetical protein D3C80_2173910 [compost metagenome]
MIPSVRNLKFGFVSESPAARRSKVGWVNVQFTPSNASCSGVLVMACMLPQAASSVQSAREKSQR